MESICVSFDKYYKLWAYWAKNVRQMRTRVSKSSCKRHITKFDQTKNVK